MIAAITIPLGLAYFWWYSFKYSNEVIQNAKKEQKLHPTTGNTIINNYELKEVDDQNHIRWQLVAHQGVMNPESGSKDIFLDTVKIEYFDGAELKMRMTAPKGIANEGTRNVKLDGTEHDRVIAENGGNKGHLDALHVELTKKNQFVATGGVNIILPGVAKVTGNQAAGVLEKDAELKNFTISGNTHALIGNL